MGTHPIFESDFRLSNRKMKSNVRAVTPKAEEKAQSVDREKTCPLLLRVFTSKDRHHRPDDFGRNQTPANELQVYTWMDATLKEITNLVKEVHPESRKKGMIFDFAICYQDPRREGDHRGGNRGGGGGNRDFGNRRGGGYRPY